MKLLFLKSYVVFGVENVHEFTSRVNK
jgi:hypothetical protein